MSAQLKPELGTNGLDLRRTGRITGSRIAAILGRSPYSDRASVLREMIREALGATQEFQGNIATEHGKHHEADALAWYEETHGVMTFSNQEFIIHPEHDFLAVTIDGMADDGLVECKAPFRSKYTVMPAYYADQVQLQIACAGAAWCDFVCWRADGSGFTQRVYADPGYIERVLPELTAFMAEYESIIRDKTKSAQHLVDKGRNDLAWQQAAMSYIQSANAVEAAKLEMDAAKDRLLALSGGNPAKGAGVQVIRQQRKGTIQYSKVVAELLPDTDLTPWQGEAQTVYSVRIDG